MRCQYCGRKIPDDSAFCPECGQRQEELSFHASQVLIQHRNQSRKFVRYAVL